MKYTVILERNIGKEVRRLDKNIQVKIREAIISLGDNPRPHGCRKLAGSPQWRIRVGDYRIIYEIADAIVTVYVVKVGHRGNVYR